MHMRYDVKEMLAGSDDIRRATQAKGPNTNKINRGVLVVIAGSKDYHGAPALAANAAQNVIAALRVGAGYVIAYIPGTVAPIVRMQSPAIVVSALGKENIVFNENIRRAIDKSNAIAIGMGIGIDRRTRLETARIIDFCSLRNKKIVIDAGAVRSMQYTKERLNLNAVITPQDSEFELLYGTDMSGRTIDARISAAVRLSRTIGAVVLLKGHETVITDGRRVKVNRAKTSALATMGTGDVLSGIIGGYAATGADTFEAAVAGAHLHSVIGDFLAKRMGNHIISTDVVESIPSALKRFDVTAR